VRTLRGRLSLFLSLGAGAVLLVTALVAADLAGRFLRARFDDALLAKARALASLAEQRDVTTVELDFADAAMPEFAAVAQPDYFEIVRADGAVAERSRSLRNLRVRLPRRLPISSALPPRFRDLLLPDGRRGRSVQLDFLPRPEEEEDAGQERKSKGGRAPDSATAPRAVFSVIVARGRAALERQLFRLHLAFLAGGLATLAALVALGHATLRAGLRPLAALTRQVEALDARSLARRLASPAGLAELAPVVEQLNALLARLEAAFERERRLSSDLAHELRTPISELRALAEVGVERQPAGEMQEFLTDAREIALQMEGVVARLLLLARLEGGIERPAASDIDLGAAAGEAWRRLAYQARRREMSLACEIPPGVVLRADPEMLSTILSNLLANAIAYGTAGGPIRCRAWSMAGTAGAAGRTTLEIENRTELLEVADVAHLFERFWRKDAARSSGSHAGLGLALARALAEAMELEIGAELGAGGRFVVRLQGPSA
jgi:two-component system sensor histidine kinase QseC